MLALIFRLEDERRGGRVERFLGRSIFSLGVRLALDVGGIGLLVFRLAGLDSGLRRPIGILLFQPILVLLCIKAVFAVRVPRGIVSGRSEDFFGLQCRHLLNLGIQWLERFARRSRFGLVVLGGGGGGIVVDLFVRHGRRCVCICVAFVGSGGDDQEGTELCRIR